MNTIPQIRPAQVAQWLQSMQQHGPAIVLDVREPSELALASIKSDGFEVKSIPMGSMTARLTELKPDQPIATLCHHGARSMQVALFLKNQGFERVANIAGGIHAWSAEVDPTVPVY